MEQHMMTALITVAVVLCLALLVLVLAMCRIAAIANERAEAKRAERAAKEKA